MILYLGLFVTGHGEEIRKTNFMELGSVSYSHLKYAFDLIIFSNFQNTDTIEMFRWTGINQYFMHSDLEGFSIGSG